MKLKVFVILLLLLLGGFVFAVTAFSKITAIDIRGNGMVPENEIKSALFSKVGDALEEVKLKNDLKAIYALGYFEDATVDIEEFKEGSKIIFSVIENNIVDNVKIEGNVVYSTKEINSIINIKPGKILNLKTMRGDIDSINQYYKKNGYSMSRVADVLVSDDKKKITFKIIEGIVEAVTLEGNETTRDYVILREMNLKPGKVFNEEILSKDLRRIFNLGYFSELVPAFEPGTSADKIILALKIKETRTNSVNFGGGFGEREGWFGFADLALNNLMGTAQGVLLKGQSGQQITTYQFKYTNPWILPEKFGPRTSITTRLWNTMGTDIYLTQQDQVNLGWDLALGKYLRDDYQVSYSIGSERVSPRGSAAFETYISNFIGLSLSYDSRDFWMNPSKGGYHTLSFRQGWKYTNITTNYMKFGLDLNFFTSLRDQLVFASHYGLGLGIGDVPIGELYWAGGPSSIRGFNLDEIKKGEKKITVNQEFRYTFNETFQGVFFFDWGDAWSNGYPVFNLFRFGWGPGLRLNTPLGPIRLDYGIGSGKNAGEGILHFSIGQAF
ncbi:MAG: hypothetical protein FD145_531 [Candidatus Saganbacteria bacterium]|uniref:POTRA domain-containing protein n=1 Tax=Candidatus Saganbacteria bacterium TaxID=2575572 RepID=A0A833L1M6_UNCSA|nr:MAG: hypothetical protein FD145_531 [Candidatus Saganbacteria bacterium]